MTTFLKKIKLLATVAMALSFFIAVTMSSCTPKEKATEDETEAVEEHPSDEATEEHPTDEADTTATEGEHPTDSESEGEHPTEEESEES